jgi:hypothetical protein
MNDKDEGEYITTLLKAINGGSINSDYNNVLYDILDTAYTSPAWNGTTSINASSSFKDKITPALEIKDGTVKIGSLEMDAEEFETCLRYLMKITKDAQPENFI